MFSTQWKTHINFSARLLNLSSDVCYLHQNPALTSHFVLATLLSQVVSMSSFTSNIHSTALRKYPLCMESACVCHLCSGKNQLFGTIPSKRLLVVTFNAQQQILNSRNQLIFPSQVASMVLFFSQPAAAKN